MRGGFVSGLLGDFRQRLTPQDLVEKEQDRIYSRQVRRALEEEQELVELDNFISRQPYLTGDKARPESLAEYVGQKETKEMVRVLLEAAKIKGTPFPHTLFWSESGLGKTTVSYLIAKELGANLIITSGGQLETKEELLNIFKQLRGDLNILFIDEVHAVPRRIAEMLYSAMEDFRFDYTTKADQAINLNLPSFTLLGATTDLARILTPMRQRFQNRFHLVPYGLEDLRQILRNYLSRIRYYPTSDETLTEIVLRSRNVARYAINYVKNLVDYCLVEHLQLNPRAVKIYFEKEGIDAEGLTKADKAYLEVLRCAKNLKAGLSTIVKTIGIDRRTVEQEIEPYLLRKKLIEIAPGGRCLFDKGYNR